MGETKIKDGEQLSPYQVRELTTLLGSKGKGLNNNVKIKDASIEQRMAHRKWRQEYELAKKNESTNIQKTSDMYKQAPKQASLVNNNENFYIIFG